MATRRWGWRDLVHLDVAFHLDLPVLKLLEPHVKTGALVIDENAVEPGYVESVRNSRNGFLSCVSPSTRLAATS